jgi:Domain of unknown function (DUF4249)
MPSLLRNRFLHILLPALLLAGCEREIEIKAPPHTPKLVVHSEVNLNDTSMTVFVNRTFPINAQVSSDGLPDATVTLFDNNAPAGNFIYQPGEKLYSKGRLRFVSGHNYRLRVAANGFPPAEAQVTMPAPVRIERISRREGVRINTQGSLLDDITVRFTDPPGSRDFYFLSLDYASYPISDCLYSNDAAVDLPSTNLDPFSTDNCLSKSRLLFSDRVFNGQVKELVFSIENRTLKYIFEYPFPPSNTKVWINLYRVQEDFYKYIRSYENFSFGFGNPFIEPVLVHNNVQGGYGILGMYAVDRDTIPH